MILQKVLKEATATPKMVRGEQSRPFQPIEFIPCLAGLLCGSTPWNDRLENLSANPLRMDLGSDRQQAVV